MVRLLTDGCLQPGDISPLQRAAAKSGDLPTLQYTVSLDSAISEAQMRSLAYEAGFSGSLPAVQLRLMEVARALASKPQLLLLDEVLAGLGGVEIEQVVQVLMGIRDAGTTIVIIEHTMHAMVRLADRLLVLDHGKVLQVGEPAAVTSDPSVIEAYLGKKWMAHAAH